MTLYYEDDSTTLHLGDSLDVLRTLPDQSVDCCCTSPPYFGLRDSNGQPGSGSDAWNSAWRVFYDLEKRSSPGQDGM